MSKKWEIFWVLNEGIFIKTGTFVKENMVDVPISIWTSSLPGLSNASSIISFLFVIPEKKKKNKKVNKTRPVTGTG